MPTRARAEADAAAAAEGKVKQPRGRKPTGYQIWDGTPPGTWRNERGEAYQPGAPSHEVEPPMPTELAGVVTQTEWSAGHAQVVEQIDKRSRSPWRRLPMPSSQWACLGVQAFGQCCALWTGRRSLWAAPIRMLVCTVYLLRSGRQR